MDAGNENDSVVLDIVVGLSRVGFYYRVLETELARYIWAEEADKLVSAVPEWCVE